MTSQGALPPAYTHQREAVANAVAAGILGRPGLYLNHVVGAGKTRTTLGIAKVRKAKRILVLAPLIALGVWQRESRKWWPIAGVQVLRAGDTPTTTYEPMISCINYDLLNEARVKMLLRWKPDLLIVDEAHYIKTPTAQRTRWTTKLAQRIPFRVLLSGTPANTPLDWWSQMRLIAPAHDPLWSQRFGAYRKQVGIFAGPHQNWIKGFRDDEVDRVVHGHVLPYTHVVGRDRLALPEPVETVIPFDLDEIERAMYRSIEQEMLIAPPGGNVESQVVLHVFAKLVKLQQVVSGYVLVNTAPVPLPPSRVLLGTSKLNALTDLLSNRPDHNVVIVCRFHESIHDVSNAYRSARVIDGSTNLEDRDTICEWFQAPGTGKIVVLQSQAGGVAITLSHADTMIFYETPTGGLQYTQVVGRIDRPGKPPFQEVLVLAANDTLEEEVYKGAKAGLDTVDLARRLLEKAREHIRDYAFT